MALHLLPRALHYVEAVARHGSIQAASRALGIAASAIDRQILSLEEACKAPLFERLPKGMRLNAAGEAVLVLARQWRLEEERLETDLREMRGVEFGTVHLTAMDSLANGVLSGLVGQLSRRHPRIRLSVGVVTPADAARLLDEGGADLALAFNLPAMRDQHRIWSAKLPFGCVVAPGHPLAGRMSARLRDVAAHPVAAQSQLLPIRRFLDQTFGWLFAEEEPRLVTNSLQLLKSAVAASDLALITSELDVAPELARGELVFVPLEDAKLVPQTITLAQNSRRPLTRAATIVSDLVVEVTEALLGEVRAAGAGVGEARAGEA